jgi:hypothetical protein
LFVHYVACEKNEKIKALLFRTGVNDRSNPPGCRYAKAMVSTSHPKGERPGYKNCPEMNRKNPTQYGSVHCFSDRNGQVFFHFTGK